MTEETKEIKNIKLTNYEAIEKLTTNFIKFLSSFPNLKSLTNQFTLMQKLPTMAKIGFIKKYLYDYRDDLLGYIRYQILPKNDLKESDFKEEDIFKLARFLKALIECSK